jgi:hypothetical protein
MRPLDRVPAEFGRAVCTVKPCEPVHSSAVHGLAGIVKPPGGRGPQGLTKGGQGGIFSNASLDKNHRCSCGPI